MKEIPDLTKKHRELAKLSLENRQLDQALYHFEAAFERQPDYELAQSLVSLLIEQGDMKEATYYLKLFDAQFKKEAIGFSLYLKLLIAEQNYLRMDCLWETQSEEIKEATRSIYQTARDYYLTFSKEFILKKQAAITKISDLEPMEQMLRSKEVKYLPKEFFLDTMQSLLKKEDLAPLVRSDWFNRLVELQSTEVVEVCDLEGDVQKCLPVEFKTLSGVLQSSALLNGIKESLQANHPSYYQPIVQLVTLHIGLNYPFTALFDKEITSWVSAYLDLFEIERIQMSSMNESGLSLRKLKIKEFEGKFRQM
ncbi:hypothetical protein [Vagococcus sp.]|uniref:hypothetical protein n=1 Tax=Vagococcus sp. TaxID=1933889 RepID=UPI003F96E279